jgi:adenylate kinase family enzyme
MKKILVIGPGGAGKSTFATQLSELLGLEVIHLDALYWKAGWVEPAKTEWAAAIDKLVEREAWVMDGNYSGTLQTRLRACDALVFLDLPRRTCIWRVLRRVIRYRNAKRPDMAQGCYEHLNLDFLVWIWNYRRRTRPKILKLIATEGGNRTIIWLRSPVEVAQYLAQLGTPNKSLDRSGGSVFRIEPGAAKVE